MSMPSLLTLEHLIVSRLLSEKALQQYAQGKISNAELSEFVKEIELLSSFYLGERGGAATFIPTKKSAIGYALYYLPINYAKIASLLSLIPSFDRPLRVLDYGAGPGTASLAVQHYLPHVEKIVLYDRAATMREVAGVLLQHQLVEIVSQLPVASARFDLIIAAHVLNELSTKEREETLQYFSKILSSDGTLLLLEPALKTTTRLLMRDRDALLANTKGLSVLFPCTQQKACPMLSASDEDWCHGTLRWEPPALVRQIDELTGFNKHRIKYAALMLTKKEMPFDASLFRVISASKKIRRGVECTLCGSSFFGKVLLAKGAKNEGNRAFQRALDYDLMRIKPFPDDGVLTEENEVSLS